MPSSGLKPGNAGGGSGLAADYEAAIARVVLSMAVGETRSPLLIKDSGGNTILDLWVDELVSNDRSGVRVQLNDGVADSNQQLIGVRDGDYGFYTWRDGPSTGAHYGQVVAGTSSSRVEIGSAFAGFGSTSATGQSQASSSQSAGVSQWKATSIRGLAVLTAQDTNPSGGFSTLTMKQSTADATAVAGSGVLFFKDNGAGKMLACVQFPTGAVQTVATEP